MAQRVEVPVNEPKDPSSIPRAYLVEEHRFLQVGL